MCLGQIWDNLDELAAYESEFRAGLINGVVADVETAVPAASQVMGAATGNPMVLNGRAVSLKPFIDTFSKTNSDKILSYVRAGFTQGQTNQQITQSILNDQLVATRRDAKTIARTSVMHMASEAKKEFAADNSDLIVGIVIIATLDGRTSNKCRNMGGRKYYFKTAKYIPYPINHNLSLIHI